MTPVREICHSLMDVGELNLRGEQCIHYRANYCFMCRKLTCTDLKSNLNRLLFQFIDSSANLHEQIKKKIKMWPCYTSVV